MTSIITPTSLCFADEMWPDKHKLLPTDPFQRAHVRIWSDYITKKV